MRVQCSLAVALIALGAAGCSGDRQTAPASAGASGETSAQTPAGPPSKRAPAARSTSSDECDVTTLGTTMFACLLPESDPRHDPAKRVAADQDCYWQFKAPVDKDLRTDATGAQQTFGFQVMNKCAATNVDVEFQSQLGTLSNWYCPFDRVHVAHGGSNTVTCLTHYEMGSVTRSRRYTLRVVAVNGAAVPAVELDPEIVLEKSGAERLIAEFKPRQAR